eukprot:m.23124 g.23124  ORF g.23124 m.23124 type:complete len:2267 (+) comp3852_c0_seq1:80-6880(+)
MDASTLRPGAPASHKRTLSGNQSDGVRVLPNVTTTPAEFVKRYGGTRVIEKILIANNGIAAVKCIRSVRRWAYQQFGNERAIEFVVMVTPEDMKANAEYIHMADHHVDVPGGPNYRNYANVELIVDIAKRTGVQAVWAGWGHASENPKLPDALHANNIVFLGPPGYAMRALGDKISSSIVAQSADVPTLAWSGSGLQIDCGAGETRSLRVPDDVYLKGCVSTVQEGLEAAGRIGYPVMIKASEGGGGKGIRKALNADQFPHLFSQVQAEVPGSPIFIMKLARHARHLEVQVLADAHGNCISLFGRDCSVQRRHQKIIEEAPALIADPEVFQEMERAAVRLAKMVGYVSAGTVEYLYNVEDNSFCFLELNPRLQVEHPCTEMVAQINLPAAQLQVGMGIALHHIEDIRALYSMDRHSTAPINFGQPACPPRPTGHVLAARITAENPDEGFKPNSGTVQELNFRSSRDVWGYFSVGAAGGLHEFADSQFGHVFAWGETREDARRSMVLALKELSIRGDFRTTVEYLIKMFETPAFLQSKVDTEWLDGLIARHVQAERPDTMVAVICGAMHIADLEITKRVGEYIHSLSRGQVLGADQVCQSSDVEFIYDDVKYAVQVYRVRPDAYVLMANDSFVEGDLRRLADGGCLIRFNGHSYFTYLKEEVGRYRLTVSGRTCVLEKDNDPTLLRSTSAGKLLKYVVEDGQHVHAGQAYAEIEVMKMVMSLSSPAAGKLHHRKVGGAILESGDIISTIELDDASQVKAPKPFAEKLPSTMRPDTVPSGAPHEVFRNVVTSLEATLLGYTLPERLALPRLRAMVDALFAVSADPKLPLLQIRELLGTISGRLPPAVDATINSLLIGYEKTCGSFMSKFPAQKIMAAVDSHACSESERNALMLVTSDMFEMLKGYRQGMRGHVVYIVERLLRQYLEVEHVFSRDSKSQEDALLGLRAVHKDNLMKIVEVALANSQAPLRSKLVIMLLEALTEKRLVTVENASLRSALEELAALGNRQRSKVALCARQLLINLHLPSYERRKIHVESIFLEAIDGGHYSLGKLERLVESQTSVFDVLSEFFYHSTPLIARAALEVYVRRAYIAYLLTSVDNCITQTGIPVLVFQFTTNRATEVETDLVADDNSSGSMSRSSSETSLNTMVDRTFPRQIMSDFDSPARRSASAQDLDDTDESPAPRAGVIAAFASFDAFAVNLPSLMEMFPEAESSQAINVLQIVLKLDELDDDRIVDILQPIIFAHRDKFYALQIRRVTFVVTQPACFPKYFTFRERNSYTEDSMYRNVDPALAFKLETFRLYNYNVEHVNTRSPQVHMYFATGKVGEGQEVVDRRFFVRSVMRHADLIDNSPASVDIIHNAGEKQLLEMLDELELRFPDQKYGRTDCNHIFLNIVPVVVCDPLAYSKRLADMVMRYGERLWKLRVMEAEVRVSVKVTPEGREVPVRFIVSNESGYFLNIQIYKEVLDPATGHILYRSYSKRGGPLHGHSVMEPYGTKDKTQLKRYNAHSNGTTYVYDFCDLFKEAIAQRWQAVAAAGGQATPDTDTAVSCVELVLDDEAQDGLREEKRPVGTNNVGMVAWRMVLTTPECPSGRTVIVIANDITHVIGSFGPKEDLLFYRASVLARRLGVPRLYIAANSGARIGLADELVSRFRVAWADPSNPTKGFSYIYLSPDDFRWANEHKCVRAVAVEEQGETRYKIEDIYGMTDGIGVENLKGSGQIAGETSLANSDIVTISLTTCRTVGIGAYLVRLGQRTIQNDKSHIILTGAGALNKVLGREVYTSNLQLGGPQIMYNNGVSHLTVTNDFEGIRAMIQWLSYVPERQGAALPLCPWIIDTRNVAHGPDSPDRDIQFTPTRTPYDPRWMLGGKQDGASFYSGFFDKGSFTETLSGWANTVVVGRARLGGIPVGVIAVETRPVEVVIPADPANINSEAQTNPQAGQVWYPDSAFKTAQSIRDFNGEGLPLFVFANWRGFSGGMRDMFEEILKFGAMIVDNLRVYKQPVFMYLPPGAELRGGAWVVVDTTINPDMIEMYADPEARGGVLEPEGTVEIKFRRKQLEACMQRLDPEFRSICESLKTPGLPSDKKAELVQRLNARYDDLEPMYHQVAVQFADLHDTAGRMKHKGVIVDVVPWKKSRTFFYYRLRRRLALLSVRIALLKANPTLTVSQITSMVRRWLFEAQKQAYLWEDDRGVADWIAAQLNESGSGFKPDSVISRHVTSERAEHAADYLRQLSAGDDGLFESLASVIGQLSPDQRARLLELLPGQRC